MARWFQQAAEAYYEKDYERWVEALENLHRLRPFNYDFMRQLVMGYALTGQTSRAFEMMLRMQQQGLAEDWDDVDEVESLRQYRLYAHLRDLMEDAGKPGGSAETVWTIDNEHAMPEALAHDEDTGRIFVGTVREGNILVHRADEATTEVFASADDMPGLMGVFDLLVDEQRGHLWVATAGSVPYTGLTPSNQGRTALLKLDLDSGEKLGEYRVLPDGVPHLLGSMTQAGDGTLYIADGAAPVVYRLRPGDERPQPLLSHPLFVSLRGIALSPDESKLYVADYELGVFFFELTDQPRGFAIGIPDNLNLGGIDGLYEWNGHLVAIQNGVTPQRVLRLQLDESGTRVASIATVARGLPEFDNPSWGAMAGDDLVFLAASHWHLVGPDGRPKNPPLPSVPVMRAPIDQAESITVGEEMIQEIIQRHEGAQRRGESG
jgi:hypothetical protein